MKVAMYVRVSTQRQALAQTIEQQLEQLRHHSQTHDWVWCDDHIFRDDGYSGASLRRPGLDRLRDQISAAVFDRLLITEPSRLARPVCASGAPHRRVRARRMSGGVPRSTDERHAS